MKPKSREQIAKDLMRLSKQVLDAAAQIDYVGGFAGWAVGRVEEMTRLSAYLRFIALEIKNP